MHRCTASLTAWSPLNVLAQISARDNGNTLLAVIKLPRHGVENHAGKGTINFSNFRAGVSEQTQERQCKVVLCHPIKTNASVLLQLSHNRQCGAGLLFRNIVLCHD